ncbi:uncharacterized protein LOC134837721 [Culicoides brevitarsis]|uniref:uncharacterized protein LOC134837721 n=1 Tax=Culicoides brevitarsis TaxID=469753 RepID=UPI00307B8B1B
MFEKLILLVLISIFGNASAQFNLTEYYRMPPLHHTENLRRCLHETEDYNVFCVVFTIIKPDNSALWHQIEVFSDDVKRHFRHDFVHSGICLRTCERQLAGLTDLERDALFVEEFPWKTGQKWYDNSTFFKNRTSHREAYGRQMNQCVNLWLKQNYNLSGSSIIHFCNTNRDTENVEYDHWHWIFLSVTLSILVSVLTASILDARRNIKGTLEHYKNKKQSPLLCFSVIRNWYRLTEVSKDEMSRDFRFLHAVRYLSVYIFVQAHHLYSYAVSPIQNAEMIETSYHDTNYIAQNNMSTVQTFYLLSGFMLYIAAHETFKKGSFNVLNCCMAIIYRYVRLVPVLLVVILFEASFLYDMMVDDGGYWKFLAEPERGYCRKNWWTNLLMINNYVNPDEMCLVHSYYIAADTQIFIFVVILLSFMFKFPKIKNWIIGIAFAMSLCIQFVVNYINKGDGMFLFTPEAKRRLYYDMSDEFKNDFITAHMNLSNFLIGVIAAMLCFYIKKRNIDLGQYKAFLAVWYAQFFMGQAILTIGAYVFFTYNFEKGVGLSLAYVFMRNIWCLNGILLLLGFVSKFESGAKRFLNWHVFTPLGRLTYSIFICHITLSRLIFGNAENLASRSYSEWFLESVGLFLIANLMAIVLCLCIEFPMTGLAKLLLRTKKKHQTENNNNENLPMQHERITFLGEPKITRC